MEGVLGKILKNCVRAHVPKEQGAEKGSYHKESVSWRSLKILV